MQAKSIPGALAMLALAAALTLATGCGGKREKPVYPVQGQVFVNKQPAVKALVILTPLQDAEPENWPNGYPRGHVQDDGAFRITSYRDGDGAPAGQYVATVLWMAPIPGELEAEVDKLNGRYADPKTSKLPVEIKADRAGNQLPAFQLD